MYKFLVFLTNNVRISQSSWPVVLQNRFVKNKLSALISIRSCGDPVQFFLDFYSFSYMIKENQLLFWTETNTKTLKWVCGHCITSDKLQTKSYGNKQKQQKKIEKDTINGFHLDHGLFFISLLSYLVETAANNYSGVFLFSSLLVCHFMWSY